MTELAPRATWKLMNLRKEPDSVMQRFLVLDTGASLESTGYKLDQMHARGKIVDGQMFRALTTDGYRATDMEFAVHQRVTSFFGHGAFAAACVNLLPPETVVRAPGHLAAVTPADMLTAGDVLGRVCNEPYGPPCLLLGVGEHLCDVILLAWSVEWMAFRTFARTSTLQIGEGPFADAMQSHKARVQFVLQSSGMHAVNSRCGVN